MTTTIAICTYNRAANLPPLVHGVREQIVDTDFDILVVDNNSTDDTPKVCRRLAAEPGAPLKYVFEPEQGIIYARNRAISETLTQDYLVFIDDDEMPRAGLVASAVNALRDEGAHCVGGRITVVLPGGRPPWFSDELFGFLGQLDNGTEPLWVCDKSTPVWSGNVAYRTEIFRADDTLRFDQRYNRAGHGVGGGSDAIMFWRLLEEQHPIRYRPDMVVEHHVEPWRLKRRYFVHLHHRNGYRHGRFRAEKADKEWFGAPLFLYRQGAQQAMRALQSLVLNRDDMVRTAMNAAYTLGDLRGRIARYRMRFQ